jgi:hypothetical protein
MGLCDFAMRRRAAVIGFERMARAGIAAPSLRPTVVSRIATTDLLPGSFLFFWKGVDPSLCF